ncbi:helix-turn-helix transcriptional regulator [Williamsia herbipolensis]|uniref:helix-turn-helix transcriptional regulator n=1 Tax=Williamsia herbipolensis TaxID=1603258 RepID=UPI0005F85D93|nr:WYL domain-containing protein [Williamsia herbipolensis]
MATTKVERLMNLVICLLASPRFVTAEQIRSSVTGYGESKTDEAFNRMFERDKTELRDLGIPLETGRDSAFSDTDGYRINRDAYELPAIALDRDEAAAVTMAAALWDTPTMAAAARGALLKLRAGGVELGADSALDVGVHSAAPRSMGSEAVLAALLAAIDHGRGVTFEHRPTRTRPVATRHLEPWGVVTHRGRWYVVGHDLERGETRTFRLSRISEPVVETDQVAHRPEGVDLREVVAAAVGFGDGAHTRSATVWVADGRAEGMRRSAVSSEPRELGGRSGSALRIEGWTVDSLARQVLGAGADAVVLEPADLRDRVIADLRTLAAEVTA